MQHVDNEPLSKVLKITETARIAGGEGIAIYEENFKVVWSRS